MRSNLPSNAVVSAASQLPPGIARSDRWWCDIYSGSADALIDSGLIGRDELNPQKGRKLGHTAFLPNGSPCPAHVRGWRDPGFKVIRQQDEVSYCVEITVSKETQALRHSAEKAASHERELQRINEELAADGKYRNWTFKQDFCHWGEAWEGTKAQIQAAGLGVGLAFPGELGAPKELRCQCPLGFDFVIRFSRYEEMKRAAGIYYAQSRYEPRDAEKKQFVAFAKGVLLEVWTPNGYGTRSNTYYGTANAIIQAGLIPELSYFPGQPGVTKMQVQYQTNWRPAVTASTGHHDKWLATIRKRGNSGQFSVEVPVPNEEYERREALRKAREEEREANGSKQSAERKHLRQGATPGKSNEAFRAERAELAKAVLDLLWLQVFARKEGGVSFDLREGNELRDDLAEAFQTIRDAVQEADILRDHKQIAAARTRLKLVAARNDKGLQSMLRGAADLRLVRSADDGARE